MCGILTIQEELEIRTRYLHSNNSNPSGERIVNIAFTKETWRCVGVAAESWELIIHSKIVQSEN